MFSVTCEQLPDPLVEVRVLFKDSFKCSLSVEKYTSFELQLVKLELTYTAHCALIYHPPKYDKDFIQDFSDFLSFIVPTTDNHCGL